MAGRMVTDPRPPARALRRCRGPPGGCDAPGADCGAGRLPGRRGGPGSDPGREPPRARPRGRRRRWSRSCSRCGDAARSRALRDRDRAGSTASSMTWPGPAARRYAQPGRAARCGAGRTWRRTWRGATSRSTRWPWASTAPARGRAAGRRRARSRTWPTGGCGSCTPPASSTIPTRLLRLARYAEPARLRGRAGRPLALAPRRRSPPGPWHTVSGTRLGAELRLAGRASPTRSPRFGALRQLGLDAALAPGFGLGEPERWPGARWRCCPPTATRRPLVLAAAAAGRGPAPSVTRCSPAWPSRPPTRDAIPAAAPAARRAGRALAGAPTSASAVAAAVGQRRLEAVPWPAALARAAVTAREAARRWLEDAAPRRAGDRRRATCSPPGCAPGPAVGRGLRAALAAKLDGRADGREARAGRGARGRR